MSRQCSDAIDRVLSHCARVRSRFESQRRTVWEPAAGRALAPIQGGLQLSVDLAKAYDRLPRRLLRKALEGVGAPGTLITLILYIHDKATIVINRHHSQERVSMGRGVRQGCGLSPLLWIAFTLLIHTELSEYVPLEAQTSYADDFHIQWEFTTEVGFRHACTTIPRILPDLASLGMEVSLSKTVVLLAIKGTLAPKLLKIFKKRLKGERVFSGIHPVTAAQGT